MRDVIPTFMGRPHTNSGARLRLGESKDLAPLVALLSTADEDLATNLLNLLGDLASRKPPAVLLSQAALLRGALSALAARFPPLHAHLAEVQSLLAGIEK